MNGIRAVHKKQRFLPFVEQLRSDVICLQETKAHKHQIEIDLPEYEEYWNSATRSGYSGTALFTKRSPRNVFVDIPPEILKVFDLGPDGYGDPLSEGRIIGAEFEDFFVINVYTPNAKDDLSRIPLRHAHWDPAIRALCKRLEQQKPVILCGDMNVAHTPLDLAHPKQNEGKKGYTKEEREGMDAFIESGMVDAFRLFTQDGGHYTWWSPFAGARERNVGWRIDYFLVSASLVPRIIGAHIHPDIYGSDHCPISIDIKD